jgi:hypothetical protein
MTSTSMPAPCKMSGSSMLRSPGPGSESGASNTTCGERPGCVIVTLWCSRSPAPMFAPPQVTDRPLQEGPPIVACAAAATASNAHAMVARNTMCAWLMFPSDKRALDHRALDHRALDHRALDHRARQYCVTFLKLSQGACARRRGRAMAFDTDAILLCSRFPAASRRVGVPNLLAAEWHCKHRGDRGRIQSAQVSHETARR